MRGRAGVVAGILVALAGAGCSLSKEYTRDAYLSKQLADYVFPSSCRAMWPDALKVVAQQGIELVGSDRVTTGQEEKGFLGKVFTVGHATTEKTNGTLESETEWNSDHIRYQVKGFPDGVDGCRLVVTAMQEQTNEVGETRKWRDYEMELAILARVVPKEAARIEQGAPK
ncbi:MAG TPA: hypothetical protein VMT17_06880 [Anaeromyxobacteraceae bacterium]|nr:hypothetical protein [Anaeromyxobacteraceae bacterium]